MRDCERKRKGEILNFKWKHFRWLMRTSYCILVTSWQGMERGHSSWESEEMCMAEGHTELADITKDASEDFSALQWGWEKYLKAANIYIQPFIQKTDEIFGVCPSSLWDLCLCSTCFSFLLPSLWQLNPLLFPYGIWNLIFLTPWQLVGNDRVIHLLITLVRVQFWRIITSIASLSKKWFSGY